MAANIVPGETHDDEVYDNILGETTEEDIQEDLYDEVTPVKKPKCTEKYESLEDGESEQAGKENHAQMDQDDAFVYYNINQHSNKRKAVYGKGYYPATGCRPGGDWKPTFLKGISNYPPETTIKLNHFLEDHERIIEEFNSTPVKKRFPGHTEFFLHTVLPDLETKLNSNGMTQDILKILLSLSCCTNCSSVNRYALRMILDLFAKTSYVSDDTPFNNFIVQCELHLKNSIVGKEQEEKSVFDFENQDDNALRIYVYSRVLMILFVKIQKGLIPLATINNNESFETLVFKLTELQEQDQFVEKDQARYGIRLIKETVVRLVPSQNSKHDKEQHSKTFLCWLSNHNKSPKCAEKKQRNEKCKEFLSQIKKSKKGWFDLHVVIFSLASQVYTKHYNIVILRHLVEIFLDKHSECARKWQSEAEWQTGLVLSSALEEIVMNNKNEDTRKEACLCLVECIEKCQRNSQLKLWVFQSLKRCLYGPVEKLRPLIIPWLDLQTEGKGIQEEDPTIDIEWSMEYLVQRYKKQLPIRSLEFDTMIGSKGCYLGTFRDEKANIKLLSSSKDDLKREEQKIPSKIHQHLVIEAYYLRRLNSKPHLNILRVFAYDTSAHPYHLITEHVSGGTLFQFLRNSRTDTAHMPGPSKLVEMMLGIMDALIYLDEQHLVHLAIMAANVLVGSNSVCKLTGFQFAREMFPNGEGNSYQYVRCLQDDIPFRHEAPESITSGVFSQTSVAWACGILVFEMHTYGVTPFNQFTNNEVKKIRNYVIRGGGLKMEECIRKEVVEIIQACLRHDRDERVQLPELKSALVSLHEKFTKEDNDWPPASYPSLTIVDLAQTNSTMDSCEPREGHYKEENDDFFEFSKAHDKPLVPSCNRRTTREIVEKTKQKDLKRLKSLKHENIAILSLKLFDAKFIALETEDSEDGDLLKFALSKQCTPDTMVSYIVQIVQAIGYMHDNNMIHSNLRAENIMVFSPNKIKIARLGRSKTVGKMLSIKCCKPDDITKRWSPPEAIKDGIYSHKSDVYSVGMTAIELFSALSSKAGSRPDDVKPFPTIKDCQVLAYLEGNNRPARPRCMPIWLYIAIKQCLLHKPAERPPLVLIEDCLTYRKPFESCLLDHWKTIHKDEIDNIDVNVMQPATANHVKESHKSFEELKKLVDVEVFMKHTYEYRPGYKQNQDEDECYAEPVEGHPVSSYNGLDKDARQPIQEENTKDYSGDKVYAEISEVLYASSPVSSPEQVKSKSSVEDESSSGNELTRPVQETGQKEPIYDDVLDPEYAGSKTPQTEKTLSRSSVGNSTPVSSLPASDSSGNNSQTSENIYEDIDAVRGEPQENSWHHS